MTFKGWSDYEAANSFMAWAAERMQMLHDMRVRHVRVTDAQPADLVWLRDRSWTAGARLIIAWRGSFLAIPCDAAQPESALVLTSFLQSAEALAHARHLGWTDHLATGRP